MNFGIFINVVEIIIGVYESIGFNGFRNNSNFFNNVGGYICIDCFINNGLFNDFGIFINVVDIIIGVNESVGIYGLYNCCVF